MYATLDMLKVNKIAINDHYDCFAGVTPHIAALLSWLYIKSCAIDSQHFKHHCSLYKTQLTSLKISTLVTIDDI